MVAIPTDAFNKWHWQKTVEFPAQAVDVIHYLQDALARCRDDYREANAIGNNLLTENAALRAEVEQHKTMEAKYYPQDLRTEVERLQGIVADAAFAPGNATLRERNAELELLLRHVICQADESSTINLDAIRAALAGTKEGDKSDDA